MHNEFCCILLYTWWTFSKVVSMHLYSTPSPNKEPAPPSPAVTTTEDESSEQPPKTEDEVATKEEPCKEKEEEGISADVEAQADPEGPTETVEKTEAVGENGTEEETQELSDPKEDNLATAEDIDITDALPKTKNTTESDNVCV